ncbi:hypothetical protein [Dyadobacter sediminis]|uniref:hypothetical protein n=1 Tax=Dyadobacter sediminis TaxID=1493691 RepID=UPI00148662A8|nr:hypothetical protein [Dyadobacter sediminis]
MHRKKLKAGDKSVTASVRTVHLEIHPQPRTAPDEVGLQVKKEENKSLIFQL